MSVLVAGCTFGSSGSDSSGLASESNGETATGSGATDGAEATSAAATSAGDNSATGMATAASTDVPPATTSSIGSDDGVADATSAGPMATGTDTGGDAGMTTGPPPPMTYPPCPSGQDNECGPGFNCVAVVQTSQQGQQIVGTVCGDSNCDPGGSVALCPQPTSGNATLVCLGLQPPACTLLCDNGETCPDGMDCYQVDLSQNFSTSVCAWP